MPSSTHQIIIAQSAIDAMGKAGHTEQNNLKNESLAAPAHEDIFSTNTLAGKRRRRASSKSTTGTTVPGKTSRAKRNAAKLDPPTQPLTSSNKVRKTRKKDTNPRAKVTDLPHNLGTIVVPQAIAGNGDPDQVIKFENIALNRRVEAHWTPVNSSVDSFRQGDSSQNSPHGYIARASAISVEVPAPAMVEELDSMSIKTETKTAKAVRRKPRPAFNETPFAEWTRPTIDECEEVARLLSSVHGEVKAPEAIPPPSLTVSGCGEVPSVLDALIRTLLSGATTGNNSAMAFQGLVKKFGILQEGVGKGSIDWNKVREAPTEEIRDAIKSGGLAEIKSKHIKEILTMVYEENTARQNDKAVVFANEHILSLDHMHGLSKDEAMREFMKYPGIGVKTAACVVLFCLRRPCFAVDTHVFRISKWLGWIPSEKVNEITAFRHLEVRVPDHLKYSLHQLFIFHGKECPRCRAMTSTANEGWEKGCIIDHLVKRTGKRKSDGSGLVQTKLVL
ncbi:endonuclease III [Emydomyces testavorans]|uniref:Endonuclease III n=1 Tax=Emydomyces testavorans TaxID=2070801 RepID=A0AAF0DN60_9EURO|nr:endonuclease III [Emydomyces testavorans]